MIKRLQIL